MRKMRTISLAGSTGHIMCYRLMCCAGSAAARIWKLREMRV
jgi:hypothetical protein